MNIKQAAAALGVAASTVHRWLNEGIIAGEQLTFGAPWRIRLTEDLRNRVAEEAPEDFLTMYQTMRLLGVSRQTVWQRVKRGEIKALHVRRGRKKGLRLKVIRSQSDLFDQTSLAWISTAKDSPNSRIAKRFIGLRILRSNVIQNSAQIA